MRACLCERLSPCFVWLPQERMHLSSLHVLEETPPVFLLERGARAAWCSREPPVHLEQLYLEAEVSD